MKQTFLYAVCGVILITAFSGCAGINALLKSGQPDLIYSKALEYYQKEKWSRASTLFEGVQHYYSGTPREDSISFFNARCKYKNRDYDTAATLLDDFRRKFGRSAFIEDAEGMYALCFYYLSPGPSRDQTMTGQALIAINEFMSRYPHSEQIENFIVDASYRFASNSVAEKQTDRYLAMLDSYLSFKEEFPESKHIKEVDRMAQHARDYLDRNKQEDNNI